MPNQPGPYGGFAPAAANVDTEGIHGVSGAAPGSPGTIAGNKAQQATNTETEGTAVAGIGGAQPGGSITDIMPWSGAGQAGSQTGQAPMSDYAIKPATEGQYGFPLGQPDVSEVYGGPRGTASITPQSPYPWVPSSTMIGAAGVIDTQIGGGSALISGLGTPPAYRAPSAGIAGSVKDTTLTDILGNQIAAMPLTSTAYAGQVLDTSYIGSPAAPSTLSTQTDTFATSTVAPVYASQQGIIPSTLVVKDTTSVQTLVLNTDYTVTTALAGPKTSLYITLIHVARWTTGDAITMTYQYGSPQYYDSNLPATQSFTVTDTLSLTEVPAQLNAWGVTTAIGALTVVDVTQANQALVYNTDYTVQLITGPYTPGNTYTETPPTTFALTLKPTSAIARSGDTITVTYAYAAAVPAAPAVGAAVAHTQTGISFTVAAVALGSAGVITPPAALVVVNTTAGARLGLVQVLNVDYTITITGSGATLAYSIARLAGSTHSNSGDTVSVTYATGNAAYFSSGPVQAVDKGVYIPWTPPAGTTEIDYYLIQASDGGTMFVPASGEPALYGQPSPSGGATSGQPVYQVDTLTLETAALAAPAGLTVTYTGTAGAATWAYRVAALNGSGTTLVSAEVTVGSAATPLTVANHTNIYWSAVPGATAYALYGRTTGAELLMAIIPAASIPTVAAPYVDNGTITPAGALPAANTTFPVQLSQSGVITPPGQLIVRDLGPTAERDPMQATGTVLELGYDYTVTQVGAGPWATYQIVLAPGSVNAAIGDTITVSYWYDTMGAVPLTAIADTVIASAAGVAVLSHADIATPPSQLIVLDTTITKTLAFGLDFTVSSVGIGPAQLVTIQLIATGPAGAGLTDHLTVYYSYGIALGAVFKQGLIPNAPPIYLPTGVQRPLVGGYQFQVAAGNRAGLGPFSGLSDYASPLNYNAPQPGAQGTTGSGPPSLNPANSINPVYRPDGTIKAGTGLGI